MSPVVTLMSLDAGVLVVTLSFHNKFADQVQASSVDWILSATMVKRSMMRQRCNNLLIPWPLPTCPCRRKLAVLTESSFFLKFYVGDAGKTPLVDVGTSLGRGYGRYPNECRLRTLAVLHPGVPVMWQTHIRDLSPTAEAVRGTA